MVEIDSGVAVIEDLDGVMDSGLTTGVIAEATATGVVVVDVLKVLEDTSTVFLPVDVCIVFDVLTTATLFELLEVLDEGVDNFNGVLPSLDGLEVFATVLIVLGIRCTGLDCFVFVELSFNTSAFTDPLLGSEASSAAFATATTGLLIGGFLLLININLFSDVINLTPILFIS